LDVEGDGVIYIIGLWVALLLSVLGLLGGLTGCQSLADVDITIVGGRSALENQVLGTYQELNNDVLQLASVRSIDTSGKLVAQEPLSDDKRQALAALQSQAFNKDDILRFRAQGWAGENRQGLLTYFPEAALSADARQVEFVQTIIAQENRDRMVLMQRVIATNAQLAESDFPQVQTIFAALYRDQARSGDRLQREDGTWMRKP
jgi:uncharacterized protein YdbL (DUF1318 family)